MKVVGETDKTGTRQQFWPDPDIFSTTVYQWSIVARRMRELAYLNAGIKITLTDLRPDPETGKTRTEVFHAKDGLKELFVMLTAIVSTSSMMLSISKQRSRTFLSRWL